MQRITDVHIRNLKATNTTQKITIGDGLSLWVSPQGKKTWYLRYYAAGKRQIASIGEYPSLSLKDAVRKADDLKARAKEEGINIVKDAKRTRRMKAEAEQYEALNDTATFRAVAEAWLEKKAITWVVGHLKRQKERLQGHLYNALGNKPLNKITMVDIDAALLPLVKDGKSETAKRACDLIRNIFEHADLMEMLENSSLPSKIAKYRRNIPTSPTKRNYYQEMTEDQIATLLHSIETSKLRWTKSTSVAIRLAPYVFLRAKELAEAEWSEINLGSAEWLIPARRMKERREHLVPLSRQSIELLQEIEPFSRGGKYVFPSQSKRNEPITTNALIQVLRRLGYKSTREEGESFVTHAFRGLASTILYQKLGYPGEHIEHQLAHAESNKIKAAYNLIGVRSYLEERRKMMQSYADYLDGLRIRIAL